MILPLLAFAQLPNLDVISANKVMQFCGLPLLPSNAQNMQCATVNNTSASVFATWTMANRGALDSYLKQFEGMKEESPIPEDLLVAPEGIPWFQPDKVKDGLVLSRSRTYKGAPETVRIFADLEELRIYFLYQWN